MIPRRNLALLATTFALAIGGCDRSPSTSAAAAADPSAANAGPTDDVIKAALQKYFATSENGDDGKPYYAFALTWKSIEHADARKGDARTDGTPANADTRVYPVRARYTIDRQSNVGERHEDLSDVTGDYVFFKDEFGTWNFKIHKHDATPIPSK